MAKLPNTTEGQVYARHCAGGEWEVTGTIDEGRDIQKKFKIAYGLGCCFFIGKTNPFGILGGALFLSVDLDDIKCSSQRPLGLWMMMMVTENVLPFSGI